MLAKCVSFALNEMYVFLNLALSHFNNRGLGAISGVSRAVCKYKLKAICCSFLTPAFQDL